MNQTNDTTDAEAVDLDNHGADQPTQTTYAASALTLVLVLPTGTSDEDGAAAAGMFAHLVEHHATVIQGNLNTAGVTDARLEVRP